MARAAAELSDNHAPDALAPLLRRAQLGDVAALDTLLLEVRRAVLRYAAAQRMGHDAEDLAQEVCLAVIKVIPEWRDTGRSMWGFVFAVARNKMTDGVRRHARAGRLGRSVTLDDGADAAAAVPDRDLGPEERALLSESTRRMDRLVRVLPATQREVVLMRTVVGLSAKETADALGLTPGSVHVLQHRALTRLRASFAVAGLGELASAAQPTG
jgi:RNA polymerase sigma-70 factor (ECF subfamily)